MFGPLLIPIFIWIIYTWQMKKSTRNLGVGASLSGILVMALFILMLAIVVGVSWLPFAGREDLINLFLSSVGGSSVNQVLVEGLWRRLTMSGTWITLFGLATLTLGLVFQKKNNFAELDDDCHADQFVMLLILGGMILTLVPEFIYLRDLFGYRINTIFKFYYQAWLMWSIAAAYGTILILRRAKSTPRYLIIALLGFSVLIGLFYPILGIQTKTNNFTRSEGMTLDGEYVFPATDSEGAAWLRNAPPGVIAEAVGGSYSSAARMATYSGNPTILGWDFHEIQWRGDGSLVWPRKEKVATIYCTHSWEILHPILEEFSVKYVVLGEIEYSTYQTGSEYCPGGLHIEKFNKHLVPVFQNSNLIIYMVPDLEMN
jgi:uncharacterized membrane protein